MPPGRLFRYCYIVCFTVSLEFILTRLLRSSHAACAPDSPTRPTRPPTISLMSLFLFSRIVSMSRRHRFPQHRSRRQAPIPQPRSAVRRWRRHRLLLAACILPSSGLPLPNDHAMYMGLRLRQDRAPPPQTSCQLTRLLRPANHHPAHTARRMFTRRSSMAVKAGRSALSCKAAPEVLSLKRRI